MYSRNYRRKLIESRTIEQVPPGRDAGLIFLDDTGLNDKVTADSPVFGLAGFAAPADVYFDHICEPWRTLKRDVLNIKGVPAHASDYLSKLSPDARLKVADFLGRKEMRKIAGIVTTKTLLPADASLLRSVHDVLSGACFRAFGDWNPDPLHWILEHSDRLAKEYFDGVTAPPRYTLSPREGFFFMRKSIQEPGLEIADLIAAIIGRWKTKQVRRGEEVFRDLISAMFKDNSTNILSEMLAETPTVRFDRSGAHVVEEEQWERRFTPPPRDYKPPTDGKEVLLGTFTLTPKKRK